VVALIGAAAWGLLRGAAQVKDWVTERVPDVRLPMAWEKPLGDAALAQLRGKVRFTTDRRVLDPLDRLAAPLLAALPASSPRFTLLVTESREVNALALPGGIVVFHRGLLARARTAEEVQGVLAHEMAHVQKRHGVLGLARSIGLDLLVQQLQGGESGVLDTLVRDSGRLLDLKFSRDHERAADDGGWDLLAAARVNPRGMLDFFAGLNEASGDGPVPVIPFLSTHPAPRERMDRLLQKAAALGPGEFRSFTGDYEALKAGLAIPPDPPGGGSSAN
jgi:predicted Zn-dependent protease